MDNRTDREQSIEKLNELIKNIKTAMLTTIGQDGMLRSRPMLTQEKPFDGDLWFFTAKDSEKVKEIKSHPKACVTYALPEDRLFVAASGTAEVLEDREPKEKYWSEPIRAWFPQGLHDPNLVVLRVRVEQAEYWEMPFGKMQQLFGFIKSVATDKGTEKGDNVKIELKRENKNGRLRSAKRRRQKVK